MEQLVTITSSEGSFQIPQHVLERLSPTMQQDLLSRQSTKFELKHSYFSPNVIAVIKAYLESGGEPRAAEHLIGGIHNDDEFMQVARACDELGLRGLLNVCNATVTKLLSDPHGAIEDVRDYFQIPYSDQLAEPVPKPPSVLAVSEGDDAIGSGSVRLTRSTLYEKADNNSSLRDFSRDVLLSKKASALSTGGTQCFLCRRPFTTLDRRHTCRSCNNSVCGSCSLFIELPKGYVPAMQQSIMTLAMTWDYSKHLVCRQCTFCIAFGVLDLDIVYITRAAGVSKKWRHAALNYGREMLDIQYKLPFQELNMREKRRLWVNRKYWVGHSKWLLQLLKSLDWSDPEISREASAYITDLPRGSRVTDCAAIWCSSRCEIHIDAGDALELLSAAVTNSQVRELAVQCLRRTSDEKLLCFLPMLVNDLRYESTPSSCALWSFLLEKAFAGGSDAVHSELCNQLYWALSVLSDGDRRFLSLQQRLIVEIAKKFGDSHALQLIRGLDFVAMLDSIPAGSKKEQVKSHLSALLPHLGLSPQNPFRLPISPEVSVTSFDLESLHIEASSTAPLVLPCHKTDGSAHRIMFKQEDLRKDWIVVNVIRFMSIILREAGMPLNILTYRVLPTSKNSGFIEMVPDSVTIFDIEVKMKSTLHKYIFDKNRKGVVGEIFDRFSSSMAGYSLVCYILALGDRHKNNIMIRDDGTLFHIDFGYILGKDAKLKATIAPYMRITPEMKEAMGGEGSAEYELFQKRCFDGMTILRRWTSVFCNMLLLLTNANPPIVGETLEQLQNIIYDRFRPDSLPAEATQALESAMQRSNDATGGKVVDTFHHIARIGGATLAPLSEGFTQTSSTVSQSVRRWWPWGGGSTTQPGTTPKP